MGNTPPYKGHRNNGRSFAGSSSSLESSTSSIASSMVLTPSTFYNGNTIKAQKRANAEKALMNIEARNMELRGFKYANDKKDRSGLSERFSKLGSIIEGAGNVRNDSKLEAIRDWQARQKDKAKEKGLFGLMEGKSNGQIFEGWGKSPRKETIRTVYIPIREKDLKSTDKFGIPSNETTPLPVYRNIYPRWPSADTEDELEKIRNWIEYDKESRELSVDTPTALQRTRSQTPSSVALGTLFEGFSDNDSYIESDEINIRTMQSEYDADQSTDEGEAEFEFYTDESETGKACRLTRSFNIGPPVGRRCPKTRTTKKDNKNESDSHEQIEAQPSTLRLRGGAKSSSDEGVRNVTMMDIQDQGTNIEGNNAENASMALQYLEKVSPERKRRATERMDRGRELLRFFEKFKIANKKKLTGAAVQELDIGIDMVNDLLAEVCSENMCIFGRYLELKEAVAAEEKKKKVEFASPVASGHRQMAREIATTDTETDQPGSSRPKRVRKRKNKNKGSKTSSDGGSSTRASEAENQETSESRLSSRNSSRGLTKKQKEKEILDKCREQAAPVKFVVATAGKTVEETKKLLWTQVVSENKTPKIKEAITLKGGDLLITPADDNTREVIERIANEGFGITKTGARLPKILIYDVDKDILPSELVKKIAEQNTDLGLTTEDLRQIQPGFKVGPKDREQVNWVCDAGPDAFKKICNRRVYLGFSVCKVVEYLNLTICNKCQKFGHVEAKCREKDYTCSYCACKGHKFDACDKKDKEPKCANCGGPYTSRHKACTFSRHQD